MTTDILNAFEQRRSGMRTARLCVEARFRFLSEGPLIRQTNCTQDLSVKPRINSLARLSRALSLERTNGEPDQFAEPLVIRRTFGNLSEPPIGLPAP